MDNTEIREKSKKIHASLLTSRGVLLILSSNFLGKTFIIDKECVVLGRNDSCDITIDDPLISKQHLSICHQENHFFIEDLDSKNSTFLNGKALNKKKQLIYGDRVIAGNTIMRFYHEEKFDS
jgi:pSer/pThr/pTyr-binding forkhead associated (FHA) protein